MSPGENEAVRLISQAGLEAEICSATRSVVRDIDVAIDAGVDSVNIIIPTSRLHIMKKLTKTPEEILEVTTRVVEHAKDRGVTAEICLEDGSRTELPYLMEIIRRAIDAGVDRVTPCDTVGTLTPEKSHESWLTLKRSEGWSYGPEKNVEQKTHPCMVPYSDLDETQKKKDEWFITMVQQMAKVLGLT